MPDTTIDRLIIACWILGPTGETDEESVQYHNDVVNDEAWVPVTLDEARVLRDQIRYIGSSEDYGESSKELLPALDIAVSLGYRNLYFYQAYGGFWAYVGTKEHYSSGTFLDVIQQDEAEVRKFLTTEYDINGDEVTN